MSVAEGKWLNDPSLINEVSEKIAEQEQRVILAPAFALIAAITPAPIPWILSKASVNPVPGGPSFFQFNPNGDITDYNDRWPWVENPFNGMLLLWKQQGILRPPLVTPYIEEIAEDLSYGIGFGFPIKRAHYRP